MDATNSIGEDLLAILKRKLVEQAAADAARPKTAPLVCGDARIGGRHLWRNNGKTMQGTLLICACGARAREGFDGDLFEEHGYGPPPANRVASTERAA